ncbi:eye-specific diacylglycerol kinase [Phlebotomus argentipes]|uniref:eye-specific diacylglycerol kinase n=1 Tax=Phlebotomus argentipes TaxID=94469 RepID=UPI002892CFFE|nr:eye-specific diacylglycerol kinase [Phlebotomus argentipes]
MLKVRSASFDEIQLEAQRAALLRHQSSADERSGLLQVPQVTNQRSRSFDSASGTGDEASTFLEVPKRFQRRRSSGTKSSPPACIHCQYLEEYERQVSADQLYFIDHQEVRSLSYSDTSSSDGDADDEDASEPEYGNILLPPPTPFTPFPPSSPCGITFTLSPTHADVPTFLPLGSPPAQMAPLVFSPPPMEQLSSPLATSPPPFDESPPPRARRRSISRQEAVFVEPLESSLENVAHASRGEEVEAQESQDIKTEDEEEDEKPVPPDAVCDIYLAVPDLKRDRAASVDSCFTKVPSSGKAEEVQPPPDGGLTLTVPSNAVRSRSVDIVLPTDEQARYKALAMAGAAAYSQVHKGKHDADSRAIRCTPDWSENAVAGDHLWMPTSVSGDCCYVGDNECVKHGPRMKCSACKIIAHANCIGILMERNKLSCKPTFRDVGIRQYREQTTTHHHWVHRRTEKGKCKQCGKSLQAKLSFGSKEIVALSCAWCKSSFHNKESCFNQQRIGEECSLGIHSSIIVPPSWIVKLPRKGSFKSSLRKSPRKKQVGKKKPKEREPRTFVIKPIPTANVRPVIVFINPKSGGNQGAKLLQKFQWLLNPRQVFDLTQGGPKLGLELFRKVPQLRILACGGDGTVGWVLSVLDQIGFTPPPAVGVLPLGTGNDLARALGWGGGYTDEPIGKILGNIGDSDTVLLDRWSLNVEPNASAKDSADGKEELPLNVVNNYFSMGVDAHIALEFHEAREAHPERFNSRLRNKMFYGQAGGKDLLKRKWKGLADFVTLECDGKDLTPKLRELKVHAIVFLNIPSYGGGTHPWNKSGGQFEPATDDGMIEVVGLTTYQLPLLQAGGHGSCITQCRSAKIVTSKTIPMQVDGEACKLKPSIIEINLLNKAVMLAKRKPGRINVQHSTMEPLNISINRITMSDYEQNHYDKDLLKQSATSIGCIEVNPIADLEHVRALVNKHCETSTESGVKLSSEWCFVDSCTAERFFRVDRAQEHLHYLTDIANEALYILDQDCLTMPQTPEDETALASPSSLHQPPNLSPSELSEKDSRECTPLTPQKKFFHRSLSGPTTNLENLSPTLNRMTYQSDSDNEVIRNGKSLDTKTINFRSFHDRLFSLSEDPFGFSNLLEKTTDVIIKAAKSGDLLLLKELHTQGYSLLSIDSTGQTALHFAALYGHKDIVRFLIAYAPNSIINMLDNEKGQTALHVAAAHKRRSVCYMLVAAGANLDIQDNEGRTPKMLAILADDHNLATYLENQEKFQLMSSGSSS